MEIESNHTPDGARGESIGSQAQAGVQQYVYYISRLGLNVALTNYQRAANRERKLVNQYRKEGWIALRSAGSHSPIDVIAINPSTREIRLIQSKIGELSKKEADEVINLITSLSGNYKVIGLLDHRV